MELVTGHAGTDHISAADMASLYRGLLTSDNVVLASGDKLSCTMLDANTAEIGTGDCMIQAHHCRVEVAEQVTIQSGSAGFNRNDLIVVRYTLGNDGVQAIYLAVIQGTAVAGEASDPSYTSGDIDGGDALVEVPLWRIPLTGVSVGTPERVMPTVDTLQKQITDLGETVNQLGQTSSYDLFASKVTVSKANHVCMLSFTDGSYTCAAGATLFTLADGYKPIAKADFRDSYSSKRIIIDTDGGIRPMDALSNTILRGSCTWVSA